MRDLMKKRSQGEDMASAERVGERKNIQENTKRRKQTLDECRSKQEALGEAM